MYFWYLIVSPKGFSYWVSVPLLGIYPSSGCGQQNAESFSPLTSSSVIFPGDL